MRSCRVKSARFDGVVTGGEWLGFGVKRGSPSRLLAFRAITVDTYEPLGYQLKIRCLATSQKWMYGSLNMLARDRGTASTSLKDPGRARQPLATRHDPTTKRL